MFGFVRAALRLMPRDHRLMEQIKALVEKDGRRLRHRDKLAKDRNPGLFGDDTHADQVRQNQQLIKEDPAASEAGQDPDFRQGVVEGAEFASEVV